MSQSILQFPAIDRARLTARLASCAVGQPIDYHPTIESTMPRAIELAQTPTFSAGGIVLAEVQTAGHGRHDRRWHTPPRQALLTSFVLKPPLFALPPTHAPMLAAVAAYDALIATVPTLAERLSLKWPNDLLIEEQKVAGLLAESRLLPDGTPAYVVLGIGINVNQDDNNLPPAPPHTVQPTSLRLSLNQLIDRTELLIHLCEKLAHWMTQANGPQLHLAWKRRLATLGQSVSVYDRNDGPGKTEGDGWFGTAIDVDGAGALIVETETGERRTFSAGDVSLRPRTIQ